MMSIYENMYKVQRNQARDSILPARRQKGMQAVQEQADGKDKPRVSDRTERGGSSALLTRLIVSVFKMSFQEAWYCISIARPYQRQRRTRTRSAETIVSVGQKRRIPSRLSSSMFQLQPRQIEQGGMPSPRGWRNAALKGAGNAIVPQIAEEIMRCITQHSFTSEGL
jgi:hypothetical protein